MGTYVLRPESENPTNVMRTRRFRHKKRLERNEDESEKIEIVERKIDGRNGYGIFIPFV